MLSIMHCKIPFKIQPKLLGRYLIVKSPERFKTLPLSQLFITTFAVNIGSITFICHGIISKKCNLSVLKSI